MLRAIVKAFRLAPSVIVAPVAPSGAPEFPDKLVEQDYMDKIVAKRNVIRFAFLAIVAALCMRVVSLQASPLPHQNYDVLVNRTCVGPHDPRPEASFRDLRQTFSSGITVRFRAPQIYPERYP